MQTESYKKRAVDLRRAARANLLEIRQARMAKRAEISLAHCTVLQAGGRTEEADGMPDELALESTLQQRTAQDEDLSIQGTTVARCSECPDQDVAASDSLDELAMKNATLVEISDPVSSTGEHQVIDYVNEQQTSVDTQHVDDWKQSELSKLPGAGPGLIWMLSQCNIETMTQLAGQNTAALASQLGPVGQILDVSQWIVFAKENS